MNALKGTVPQDESIFKALENLITESVLWRHAMLVFVFTFSHWKYLQILKPFRKLYSKFASLSLVNFLICPSSLDAGKRLSSEMGLNLIWINRSLKIAISRRGLYLKRLSLFCYRLNWLHPSLSHQLGYLGSSCNTKRRKPKRGIKKADVPLRVRRGGIGAI
jgi:hypothetical protein